MTSADGGCAAASLDGTTDAPAPAAARRARPTDVAVAPDTADGTVRAGATSPDAALAASLPATLPATLSTAPQATDGGTLRAQAASPVAALRVLPGIGAGTHRPHALHAPERLWTEKNCYLDLWIELVHALHLEPRAMLGCVATLDWDVDQWTFVKPPPGDLRALYGLEVQELTFWRPLLEHAVDHLAAGRWIAVEVDAHWLPDTAGIDYRRAHAKTTIVLDAIDLAARRLGYFHNAGYFELEGEDFEQLLGAPAAAQKLPPFAETIRIDRRRAAHVPRAGAPLRAASLGSLREHLRWRATTNPIEPFGARFAVDLETLRHDGGARFHRWAFAGLRQLGAAAEALALYLRWLGPAHAPLPGVVAFERIAVDAKTLLMKTARAAYTGKAVDAGPLLASMKACWEEGFAALEARAAEAPSRESS